MSHEMLFEPLDDTIQLDIRPPGKVVQIRLPSEDDETSDEIEEKYRDSPLGSKRPSEVEEMLENNSLITENLNNEDELDDHGLLSPITGFFSGCLAPMFSVFSKRKKVVPRVRDELEIPFEDLKDLQFIDSGGQGAVYRAEHQGRIVAVKKVRDPKEIEIKHLLKLKHDNIIEFR